MIEALGGVLDEIEAKKGQREAVIFTESARTQRHLSELLPANGYEGRKALMNSTNADAARRARFVALERASDFSFALDD